MTDKAAVSQTFVQKFSEWSANVLPNIFPNWNEMSENVKDELSTINDVCCGKYLILNLQEHASSALNEWEKVECKDGQFGREQHKHGYLWEFTENISLFFIDPALQDATQK